MTKPSTYRNLILLWAGIAIIMAGTVVWAATQVDDPLSRYIHTDKMRHILAFGAIGLCAGLLPTKLARLVGLGAVLTFAMAVEIIQIPIPDRSASVSDLFASGVGALAGFGLGAAIISLWEMVRERMKPAHKHS
jgi:VanZ family protein